MKVDIEVTGIQGLLSSLDPEQIKPKIRNVIKRYGADLQRGAVRRVPVDTGHLKRSIQPPEIAPDGMSATVRATAEYAAYVELGTRFMEAQPFLGPALNEVKPAFFEDLSKVMK